MRRLSVYLNDIAIGMLSEEDDIWSFEYVPDWTSSPTAFDLSPALSRHKLRHVDGASNRAVQWYFDNLLPEEAQRSVLQREAGIRGDDAFGLLQYLGAESAGSLVLTPAQQKLDSGGTKVALNQAALSRRIRDLPRVSLSHEAPKRMSVAGAQNKLLVVFREGQLFEPMGMEPSTHILKPEHGGEDYPNSVMNEFAMMTLARHVGLAVPSVSRLYVPEPVYIVERFDRYTDQDGQTHRSHIIDACQLLNKPRAYKYAAASLDALTDCIEYCSNSALARQQLFRWLVFNVLVGNDDIHLKNLSFAVNQSGITLCQAYDLLSTAAYHTRAYADERALWPNLPMMIGLPSAQTFNEVNRGALLDAGVRLGLTRSIAEREIEGLTSRLLPALDLIISEIQVVNRTIPAAGGLQQASDLRLLRTIRHIVLPDMLSRL